MGRPPRQRPADFDEMFVAHGWEARDHYGVHTDTFTRWIAEQDRDALRRRRRNYVIGRRLSSLKLRVA